MKQFAETVAEYLFSSARRRPVTADGLAHSTYKVHPTLFRAEHRVPMWTASEIEDIRLATVVDPSLASARFLEDSRRHAALLPQALQNLMDGGNQGSLSNGL